MICQLLKISILYALYPCWQKILDSKNVGLWGSHKYMHLYNTIKFEGCSPEALIRNTRIFLFVASIPKPQANRISGITNGTLNFQVQTVPNQVLSVFWYSFIYLYIYSAIVWFENLFVRLCVPLLNPWHGKGTYKMLLFINWCQLTWRLKNCRN